MRLILTLIALCATLSAADDISDALDELKKLPCAVLCYNAVAIDNQCTAGDFNCVCNNPGQMAVKMGICVGKADCEVTKSVTFDSSAILEKICAEVQHGKPAPSQIAAASSKVVSIYSSIAATATSNPTPKNGAVGRTEDVKLALAAAAAVVAIAL